jgi:DNA (cytosine-5)-methyltransferase 1
MTFGSLFSGIGGMDLGLERAGMRCVFQVEIDDYCRRVLAKHWPDVPRYGDIREVTGEQLGYCDVLAGGFPCQDVSQIGGRAGIEGPQSGLWAEFVRLVDEIRPRYVLVENTPGLLGRGMGRVLGDLAMLGFDAEWEVLAACEMGAPHTRERVFIVAYPEVVRRAKSRWPASWQGRYPSLKARGSRRTDCWEHDPNQSGMGRVVHGVPDRVERVAALGNAVVPQVAEWIGRRIMEEP